MNKEKLQRKSASIPIPPGARVLQRKCGCGQHTGGGDCDSCQKNKDSKKLQRSAVNDAAVSEAPGIVNDVLRSPGQPLDRASRAFFEPRFGQDFSRVRVHTDYRAAQSAKAVNALAYTVGSDVVFASGQYHPQSEGGRTTLAHELSHVVQQGNSSQSSSAPLEVGSADDSYEQEAHATAQQAVSGAPVSVQRRMSSSTVRRLQRQAAQDTHAGQFEFTKHDPLGGPTFAPQAQYDVKIEFLPYEIVDCEEIAMTQTLVSRIAGALLHPSVAQEDRALTAAEGTEGVSIDRLSGRTSPLYGVDNTGTAAANTHFGSRTAAQAADRAWMTDRPGLTGATAAASRTAGQTQAQHFETCAICNKGADKGAYYGCVSWGYDIDASDVFTQAAFARVSRGTPSASFLAAAKKWNDQTVPVATDDLPLPTHATRNTNMTRAQLEMEIGSLTLKLITLVVRGIVGNPADQENRQQISFELKVLKDIHDAIVFNEGVLFIGYEVEQAQAAVGARQTGQWTYETIQKLKVWQAKENLPTTGQLDPESLRRMNISRVGDFPEPSETLRHTA